MQNNPVALKFALLEQRQLDMVRIWKNDPTQLLFGIGRTRRNVNVAG